MYEIFGITAEKFRDKMIKYRKLLEWRANVKAKHKV
jgi:hypothetical protein